MDTATETQQDHPPLLTREPGRAGCSAAVHSAADWLASSDASLPTVVELRTYLDTGTLTERLAGVHAFADQHGLSVHQSGTAVWCVLELAAKAEHGCAVHVVMLAVTDMTREAWDRA